jgi:DNA sulfur modification protein DndB
MNVSFPAMRGQIGQREYFACLMKLGDIPGMFTFKDWIEFTPEDREQRVLNKKRVPEIAKYILDNEDGYLFASITASYKSNVSFAALDGPDGNLGTLSMELGTANFVINDGQHRCAAIAQAVKMNPALADEHISVLLFPYESRGRVQQMFSDLNRFVVKTSKSLDILYDKRDPMSTVTLEVCDRVPVFKDQVDKDAVSLPVRSRHLFSLSALYDANHELLRERVEEEATQHELVATAVEYWKEVSKAMPAWGKVKIGDLKAMELRQSNLSSHATVLRAIGAIGAELMREHPADWKAKVAEFGTVDWRKSNRDWENICIVAGSVVSNRQARAATKAYLKRHLDLPLTDSEAKSLPEPALVAAE